MLSSDSQSALLPGLLDFLGLLICECFRLYSVMASKGGWGGGLRCEVGGGGARGNWQAEAEWVGEEE